MRGKHSSRVSDLYWDTDRPLSDVVFVVFVGKRLHPP